MRLEILIPLLTSFGGLIFAAGGIYYAFRRLKKDVDGVGRKLNQIQTERSRDAQKILTVFLLFSTDSQREKIAQILNG